MSTKRQIEIAEMLEEAIGLLTDLKLRIEEEEREEKRNEEVNYNERR